MSVPRMIVQEKINWTDNLSQPIFAGDFRNIGITLVGTGSISVLGSKSRQQDPIDFSQPSTLSNSYAIVIIADETIANTYTNSLSVVGSTKIGEVNTNELGWICLSRSADTVDAFVTMTDNR